jgi:hypothetical protein
LFLSFFVATFSFFSSFLSLAAGKDQYSSISHAEVLPTVSSEDLAVLFGALKAGGALDLKCADGEVEGRLLLCGFDDVVVQGESVTARKPEWEGAAQSLKTKAAAPAVWKLEDDDLMEEDLVDENDLLKDIDNVVPGQLQLAAPGADECGPSKKACKNCVCGRAEEESQGILQEKQKTWSETGAVETSASGAQVVDTVKLKAAAGGCGSCSLGDAFRCAGCPSRGLPAYTVGEKIVLNMDSDI